MHHLLSSFPSILIFTITILPHGYHGYFIINPNDGMLSRAAWLPWLLDIAIISHGCHDNGMLLLPPWMLLPMITLPSHLMAFTHCPPGGRLSVLLRSAGRAIGSGTGGEEGENRDNIKLSNPHWICVSLDSHCGTCNTLYSTVFIFTGENQNWIQTNPDQ